MAAPVAVYETARTPEWDRMVKRLARAKSVFVVGFQTERGFAQIFVHQMQYLRDRVQLIDLTSGNFADVLAPDDSESATAMFEAPIFERRVAIGRRGQIGRNSSDVIHRSLMRLGTPGSRRNSRDAELFQLFLGIHSADGQPCQFVSQRRVYGTWTTGRNSNEQGCSTLRQVHRPCR